MGEQSSADQLKAGRLASEMLETIIQRVHKI